MVRSSSYRKKAHLEEDIEVKIGKAMEALDAGRYKNLSVAAADLKIPYQRLRRRYQRLTRPRRLAHEKQMYLSPAKEETVCNWIKYLGMTGHAVSKRTLAPKIQEVADKPKPPSREWIRTFLKRHPDLVLKRPTGLDPKRARAFNYTTVNHHFKLLDSFLKKHKIPWENVYNMDEKGIQLGGGRKNGGIKYFYSREQREKVKLSSDDLKLVTIIECVCADGTSIKPGFVFQGVAMCPEWFVEDGTL